jgi:hypothetical protein
MDQDENEEITMKTSWPGHPNDEACLNKENISNEPCLRRPWLAWSAATGIPACAVLYQAQ